MPLKRENRRRQITLNVSPYIYDVDAVALSLINQFKADEAAPEITKLDEYKLSLTFRETDELTYEVACQKILWNQYVQNIEQKNVTNNIELLKKLVDPYFDSPVVASINGPVNEVLGKGQLDGISPSAFSDGEMLWADGKPMPHPEYNIDLGIRPEGPPLLTKDINKAVQPSTITATMDKDTFFCADGVMKVGDEFHPVTDDYYDENIKEQQRGGRQLQYRGGCIELPNKHLVSVAWGTINYSENHMKKKINETPKTAEVGIISPQDKFINLDDPNGVSHVYAHQTTEQVKELIRRTKEL